MMVLAGSVLTANCTDTLVSWRGREYMSLPAGYAAASAGHVLGAMARRVFPAHVEDLLQDALSGPLRIDA